MPKRTLYRPDMTNVQTRGAFRIPEGYYRMRLESITDTVSRNGNPQYVWTFRLLDGPGKGRTLLLYTVTTGDPWKLRETLVALNHYADGAGEIDLDQIEGQECLGQITDDEWQGQIRSRLKTVFPKNYVPPRSAVTAASLTNGEGDDDDDVEEPEEEDEEEEQTAATAKKRRAAAAKVGADEVMTMELAELEQLVDEAELERVDLARFPTLSKKRSAVVRALGAAGMLAD